MSQTELKSLLARSRFPSASDATAVNDVDHDVILTPWFRLLCERDGGPLFKWWDNVDNVSDLKDNEIHHWT